MLIFVTKTVIKTIIHNEYLANTSGLLTVLGILILPDNVSHLWHYMYLIILFRSHIAKAHYLAVSHIDFASFNNANVRNVSVLLNVINKCFKSISLELMHHLKMILQQKNTVMQTLSRSRCS